jgi:hypothetical protein
MIEWLMRHEIKPHIPLLDREQDYHADRMWAGARDARNERKRLLTE